MKLLPCLFLLGVSLAPLSARGPIKVFILAGQSNLDGAGHNQGDPNHNEGKDVSLGFLGRKGKLAAGLDSRPGNIGPELGLGHVLGNAIEEDVPLIRTARGGKSPAVDFRPPRSGGEAGRFSNEMPGHVNDVLEDLKKEFSGLLSDPIKARQTTETPATPCSWPRRSDSAPTKPSS